MPIRPHRLIKRTPKLFMIHLLFGEVILNPSQISRASCIGLPRGLDDATTGIRVLAVFIQAHVCHDDGFPEEEFGVKRLVRIDEFKGLLEPSRPFYSLAPRQNATGAGDSQV